MTSRARQTTLRRAFSVSGIGMHTGEPACVRLIPSGAGSGIRVRACGALIPAHAERVESTRRCTRLGSISTVEHLLSALFGLQIDNVVIEVDGPEIPILDGSALPWVEQIQAAGVKEVDAARVHRSLDQPLAMRDGDSWYTAAPADRFHLTCATEFDHPLLGVQCTAFRGDPQEYAETIAPARTFGFIEEVEALLAAGLARGGSLQNALIVYPDRFSDAERLPQECARHKALDVIGDLALAGGPFTAQVTAIKPSHSGNVRFAALLAEHLQGA